MAVGGLSAAWDDGYLAADSSLVGETAAWLMKRQGNGTVGLLFRGNLAVDQHQVYAPKGTRTLYPVFSAPVCKLQRNSIVFRLEWHCGMLC